MERLLCSSGIVIFIGVVGFAIYMKIWDCPSRIVNVRSIRFRDKMRLITRWGQRD
jgi:hypothetical protein